MDERNLFTQPLAAEEIRRLASRAGGVQFLVAPTRRSEAEGMTDPQLVSFLAGDPARVRRPIIDTGDDLFVGFSTQVQQQLGG